MDTRLNAAIATDERLRSSRDARALRSRDWPDDGLPPRGHRDDRRLGSLHPFAVLASLIERD